MESGRFLSIKIGEGDSHFGNDDLFFFLCNCFPERAAIGSVFLFRWRRVTNSWENIYLYHEEPVGNFV